MTTITISIANPKILASLKKILGAIEGVTITKVTRERRSELDQAREQVRKGQVDTYTSTEVLFQDLGI